MSASAMQAAPSSPRRRSLVPRTRRGRVAAILAALVAIPALAWAIYFALLNVTGTVSGGALNVTWGGIAADPVFSGMDTCTVGINSGDLNVNATGGFPGASCTFAGFGQAQSGSSTAVVISGTDATGMPEGWTLNLQDGVCGTVIEPSGVNSLQPIGLELAVAEDAETVASGSFGPDVGVLVTPANAFDPAMCTP